MLIRNWLKSLSNRVSTFVDANRLSRSTRRRRLARRWDVESLEPRILMTTTYSTEHDRVLTVTTQIVPPGSGASVGLVTNPQHGVLNLHADGSFVFSPATRYVGGDTFSYAITYVMPMIGTMTMPPVEVDLHVWDMSPALGNVGNYWTNHDHTLTVSAANGLLQGSSDAEGDPLAAQLVTQAQHGTVTIGTDGSFTYSPVAHWVGVDTFVYKANDGFTTAQGGDSLPKTIQVTAMNTAPTVPNASASAYVNLQISTNVLTNSTDAEGDPLSLVSVTRQGTALGQMAFDAAGNVTYTAGATAGTDTFACVVSDGVTTTTSMLSVMVVMPTPPTITLNVAYGTQKTVTLSGQVTDVEPGGHTVTFSGMVTGSVVAQANGTFSFTAQATGLGSVSAVTQDASGISSNTAQALLASNAPVISNFVAIDEGYGYWTFQGSVADESPSGLVVNFGDVIAGNTATVASNGSFELTLAITTMGEVTAQITDWWGLQSNLADTFMV